jgi:signal transduction histidine kinase
LPGGSVETQLTGIIGFLDKLSPMPTFILGGIVILSIGAISYITTPLFSSSLLYLIPILIITHVAGFRSGLIAATLAALIWLSADIRAEYITPHKLFENTLIPYWNVCMRLGSFLVAVALVSAIGSLNADLEKRVHERTCDLEAKIAEKRELEKTILEISDTEQVRIGQDLHDGLCQQLVSAAFSANLLKENLEREKHSGLREANLIATMVDDAITQARNLARGLYPTRLETEGLEMALRELTSTVSQRFGILCRLDYDMPLTRCKPSVGIHLYRIVQEAVINAAKHASPRHIVISLATAGECVRLVIEDDGIGIANAPLNPGGMGLRIMEYRARMIGATFTIQNIPHHGTRLTCQMEEISLRA